MNVDLRSLSVNNGSVVNAAPCEITYVMELPLISSDYRTGFTDNLTRCALNIACDISRSPSLS